MSLFFLLFFSFLLFLFLFILCFVSFFLYYGSFSVNVGGDMYKSSKNEKTKINKHIANLSMPIAFSLFWVFCTHFVIGYNMVWWILLIKSKFGFNLHVTWFTTLILQSCFSYVCYKINYENQRTQYKMIENARRPFSKQVYLYY